MTDFQKFISTNNEYKKLLYVSALKDIAELWGNQEIGTCEISIKAISEYVNNSYKFAMDTWDITGENEEEYMESMYQYITDLILNGFPIWKLLKLSDWTKDMVTKTFNLEMEKKYEEECKIYKCYTCKYYKYTNTSLGVLEKCTYEPPKKDKSVLNFQPYRKQFKIKKSCKNYIKK